jgi:hypothetical protein
MIDRYHNETDEQLKLRLDENFEEYKKHEPKLKEIYEKYDCE